MSNAPAPRAVLFDHDGVLVDSEPLHRTAWERTFGARGIAFSDADYAWSVGRRDLAFAELAARRFGLGETPVALRDEKRAAYHKLLAAESRTFPGVPELLRRLAPTHRLGIASSAVRRSVDIVIARFGFGCFQAIVSSEDVRKHKPDPEPYVLCAARLGVRPADCVALEDSPPGIQAAKTAGMRVIGFTSTFGAADLQGADAVVESLEDTDALVEFIRSPAAPPGQM